MDWLVSDIVSTPDRTLALLENWLEQKWMKQFCVTMKFKGDERAVLIDKLRQLLSEQTQNFWIRHLENNKNEVTAIGVV